MDCKFVSAYLQSDTIKGVRWLTPYKKFYRCVGDTFGCTWADDDRIYTCADDTRGVDHAYNSNLAFLKVEGNPPEHRVENVNPMSAFGGMCEHEGDDTWKACNTLFVDGVLYMSMSQHSSAGDYPDLIQRAFDSQIIMSTDYGKTWSKKRKAGNAMWPGPRFANPYFVQFGKAYEGAMDEYVYAVSNSGTWNNGNYMVLGRVKRSLLPRLEAGDWEYFFREGGEANGKMTWTKDLGRGTAAIFVNRHFTSMTGMQWVPAIKRFILPQWAYMDLDRDDPWHETLLHIYEAEKPWGPWKHVHTEYNWGEGEYCPCLPAKWFEDGGKQCWMVSSGDFCRQTGETPSYSFTVQKMEWIL